MHRTASAFDPFVETPITLASALGPMELGIVDASRPGVAEGISRLLFRSIADARASVGGHLPDWLVRDIERNYISPEKVRTLWAPFGHRFAVVYEGEIVATIHVAREHDTIFTVNRDILNVSARAYPGFKPERHHHVVNISVKHEVRRARIATAMVDAIVERFRERFDGDGLWVRADPPWHVGLVGLGFVHDPRGDLFLPESAERTAGLPHAELNARYACACQPQTEERARAMGAKKLQYVSLTRPFATRASVRGSARIGRTPELASDDATLDEYARDWGMTIVRRPRAVATPATVDEVVDVLRYAFTTRSRVVVRGRGHSTGGQSLAEDAIVLATERLSGIVRVDADRIEVEAGTTWADVLGAAAPRLPPVVTGWLPATVGGTLSTGGVGKGSHRFGLVADHVLALDVVTGDGRLVRCSAREAAWLFDAAVGGLGRVGIVVRATLALAEPAAPCVRIERTGARDVDSLRAQLDAAAAHPATVHVTAYRERDAWVVVRAVAAADGIPLAEYLAPARPVAPAAAPPLPPTAPPPTAPPPTAPPPPAVAENVFADAADLERLLASRHAIQVAPIAVLRRVRPGLLQTPAGATAYLVCFGDIGERFGAKTYLTAAVPGGDAAWRAHLGAAAESFARAKRLADPANVFGAPLLDV